MITPLYLANYRNRRATVSHCLSAQVGGASCTQAAMLAYRQGNYGLANAYQRAASWNHRKMQGDLERLHKWPRVKN